MAKLYAVVFMWRCHKLAEQDSHLEKTNRRVYFHEKFSKENGERRTEKRREGRYLQY
jgi:hypothetical protein